MVTRLRELADWLKIAIILISIPIAFLRWKLTGRPKPVVYSGNRFGCLITELDKNYCLDDK